MAETKTTAIEPALPHSDPPSLTVAETILRQLRLWGVRRIYGVAGDAIFGLLDALAKQDDLAFISVKHESVASMMASAEAKLTGQLSVCIAQMGPGLANLLTGLGDAFMDKAPVLAITGHAPLDKLGTPYKQSVNQQSMVQSVTGSSQLVVHPDAIIPALKQAHKIALSNRTPVHLSIPGDLFHLVTKNRPEPPPLQSAPVLDPDGLTKAIEIIRTAQKPMMLVGGGALRHRDPLQAFAEAWSCGLAMGYGAAGIFPDDHPQLLNGLGEGGNPYLTELFKDSDVVLVLETDWWPERSVPSHARVIHLAVRPDIYDATLPVEIELAGDLSVMLTRMAAELDNYTVQPEWMNRVKHCKQIWKEQSEGEKEQTATPLHPAGIIRELERHLDDEAIIALDEGDSTLWFLRSFAARRQQVLLSGRWRTMGFGLPAAMAAKLIDPHKQVVCITGDGGLGMVLADLLTAARYGLAIVAIVFDNGTLQMERDKMIMKGLEPEGTAISNPDFVQIARACGWHAQRIQNGDELDEALASIRSLSGPALLSVETARIPHPDYKK
ncbi:thiamine pyrophosphate-binding protein [Paenibacillus humicola]|uniref:thiamine pyrophosphate-binding protein n=1 Tax=Paenibacillus humicola TaxID=3110540 RepID=UPI00237B60E4|nr:thiamine pyrophosphate-binding protein [Paenibacillus humicola]